MYGQPETILEKYDMTVLAINKGRGVYVCDTSQGKKALLTFKGSKERAQLLDGVLQYLKSEDFITEQICKTKEGEILSYDEAGTAYLLKDMLEGPECSTKNIDEMTEAARTLARLHLCMERCPVIPPDYMEKDSGMLMQMYEKHNRELIKVKNYVKSRKRKNEFEMRFQNIYPHFMEQATKSVTMLTNEKNGYHFCHGDLNQHNILCMGDNWTIINFENLDYNILISDLSNFLRKMMEKNDWDRDLGSAILHAYNEVRTIKKEEYRQLYILLLFPEKFWKIANHYYNSHKAWLSGRDIEKLDKMMAQEEARERFLENLFSIIA